MESIDDPTSMTGISSLLNVKHVNTKYNLEAIEKALINKSSMKPLPETDPMLECRKTIKELSEETGYNLEGTVEENREESDNGVSRPVEQYQSADLDELMNDDGIPEEQEFSPEPMEEQSNQYQSPYQPRPPRQVVPQPSPPAYRAPAPRSPYREQTPSYSSSRNRGIDDVLKVYGGKTDDVDLDDETAEEEKAILLEDIDELRVELTGDGVNLDRIPEVTEDSPMELVKKVNKILKRKYDRKRCNGFGTELILAGAQGLEYIFDGKRKFGPYCPNLTGWHNTIRPKLRRMKYETSTIVANIMNEYYIGATARILLELVPSAILYSRMKRDQHGTKNYTPDQMSEAYDDLRQFE